MADDNRYSALLAKPMHGKFFAQQKYIPQVDLTQSHQWLKRACLNGETKTAICAAQDQAMTANLICHKIYKQAVNPLCRLCRKYKETIAHITSRCNMLCGTKYSKCHNKVCAYLHWCILQDEVRIVVPNWRQHKAAETLSICLEDGCTLMYNKKQRIDHGVAENCPDIVYLDKKKRTALLIDVTYPVDVSIITAATTKHKNY
eukprot:2834154-Ditylum_brightwellii.AAC.1